MKSQQLLFSSFSCRLVSATSAGETRACRSTPVYAAGARSIAGGQSC